MNNMMGMPGMGMGGMPNMNMGMMGMPGMMGGMPMTMNMGGAGMPMQQQNMMMGGGGQQQDTNMQGGGGADRDRGLNALNIVDLHWVSPFPSNSTDPPSGLSPRDRL